MLGRVRGLKGFLSFEFFFGFEFFRALFAVFPPDRSLVAAFFSSLLPHFSRAEEVFRLSLLRGSTRPRCSLRRGKKGGSERTGREHERGGGGLWTFLSTCLTFKQETIAMLVMLSISLLLSRSFPPRELFLAPPLPSPPSVPRHFLLSRRSRGRKKQFARPSPLSTRGERSHQKFPLSLRIDGVAPFAASLSLSLCLSRGPTIPPPSPARRPCRRT